MEKTKEENDRLDDGDQKNEVIDYYSKKYFENKNI